MLNRLLMRLTGAITLALIWLTLIQPGRPAGAQFDPTLTPTPRPTATPFLTQDYCPALPAAALSRAYFQTRQRYNPGCPVENPVVVPAAFQRFERGAMLWFNGRVYVIPTAALSGTTTTAWSAFADTWDESQPPDDPALTAPPGLQQPIRGFGKVWREELGGPAAAIGWAVEAEVGYQATLQPFERGLMVTLPGGEAIIDCSACQPVTPAPPPAEPPVWQSLDKWGQGFIKLAAGNEGEIWAITPARLFRFEGAQVVNFLVASNFLTETWPSSWQFEIRKMAVAPDGSPWLATTYGVYRAEGDLWPHWLADKSIKDITFDAQGRPWVVGQERHNSATGSGRPPGFIKFFDGQQWQDAPPITLKDNDQFDPVALAATPDGHMWVAMWESGLYEYDGQTWLWRGLGSSPENTVVANRSGQLWNGGISNLTWRKWQGSDWSEPPPSDAPNYHPVRLLAVDNLGHAWGARVTSCYFCKVIDLNRTGAVYYGDDGFCLFTAADGLGGPPLDPPPLPFDTGLLRPDAVFDIAVNTDDSVWFITQGQMTVFRPAGPVCGYDTYPLNDQAQQTIETFIANQSTEMGASEYQKARKIVTGDLDGDGDADAAVQYTLEGMGGGNTYQFFLVVFLNNNGAFSYAVHQIIGGKGDRTLDLTQIKEGKIYFDILTPSPDKSDWQATGSTQFTLQSVQGQSHLIER